MSPATAVLALVLAQARAVDVNALSPRPHIAAVRTAQAPAIDGRLDDAAWAAAPPSDGFVQHFPDEGAPPSEHTTMRVLYDDILRIDPANPRWPDTTPSSSPT